jgi:hypothetical protein
VLLDDCLEEPVQLLAQEDILLRKIIVSVFGQRACFVQYVEVYPSFVTGSQGIYNEPDVVVLISPPAITFGQIGWDRFSRTPNLSPLFVELVLWESVGHLVYFHCQSERELIYRQITIALDRQTIPPLVFSI